MLCLSFEAILKVVSRKNVQAFLHMIFSYLYLKTYFMGIHRNYLSEAIPVSARFTLERKIRKIIFASPLSQISVLSETPLDLSKHCRFRSDSICLIRINTVCHLVL